MESKFKQDLLKIALYVCPVYENLNILELSKDVRHSSPDKLIVVYSYTI